MAMSLRGYWRTESARIDCSPAMRITRLTTIARTGRLMKRSVNFTSALLGLGRRVVGRLLGVVDLDGRAVAELEDPGRHDFLAGLQAGEDGDLVAAPHAELDEALRDAFVRVALLVLQALDDENRVA